MAKRNRALSQAEELDIAAEQIAKGIANLIRLNGVSAGDEERISDAIQHIATLCITPDDYL